MTPDTMPGNGQIRHRWGQVHGGSRIEQGAGRHPAEIQVDGWSLVVRRCVRSPRVAACAACTRYGLQLTIEMREAYFHFDWSSPSRCRSTWLEDMVALAGFFHEFPRRETRVSVPDGTSGRLKQIRCCEWIENPELGVRVPEPSARVAGVS
ncbi:hypothetical protein BGZ61DRAFT_234823 [Ilyonectria robusta]|uniref:uncharacterized protein n=1 Tax=Ilyonectria robusta TaxID=1079257 RepID=UPI001E8DAA14|nr:uncharacterized protein BGZ61DRAFT_234823 [Ilyonectria robusta]KAH8699641.1 hypothetical protein BGZ61DRAFT_234823 [Ilyonectria robusta]